MTEQLERLQERVTLLGVKSLTEIQSDMLGIDICGTCEECEYKDEHVFINYCTDFEAKKCMFCDGNRRATEEERKEYYINKRLERIEAVLRIDARLKALNKGDI